MTRRQVGAYRRDGVWSCASHGFTEWHEFHDRRFLYAARALSAKWLVLS